MTFTGGFCMYVWLKLAMFFACLLCSTIWAADEGIKVHFIKRYNDAAPGQDVTLQVYVTNLRSQPIVLVGHFDLPPQWKAIPANDIMIHLMPNQNAVQTLFLNIPEYEQEGEFRISYEVFGRNNPNVYDKDSSTILVRYPRAICRPEYIPPNSAATTPEESCSLPVTLDNENSPQSTPGVSLSITSEQYVTATTDEMMFISCFIKNETDDPLTDRLSLNTPEEWQVIPEKKSGSQFPRLTHCSKSSGSKCPRKHLPDLIR